MNELRDLAREGLIADFADKPPYSLANEEMTGLSLRVDDYWLAWYWHRYHFGHPWGSPTDQRVARTHYGHRYDFSQRPDDWLDRCKKKGMLREAHPVAIIVILRNEQRNGLPEEWPRFVGEHPVIYEHRPEAILQALASGDSVLGASSGTLGGYLWRASDGRHFALSCAHVFGQGSASTVHAGSAYVGSVVESHFPPASTGKCNNRIQGPVSSRSVDVAVADLAGSPSIQITIPKVGKLAAQTSIAQIGQGDLVTLTGATSGTLSAKVKECNIWKEMKLNGTSHCFGDLLVIEDVFFHYIASQFTKAGDSGAWVVSTAAGHASWDAMLIAGDGANAYCSYAENIMAIIDSQLTIPP
jgi:hypothetical protein